MWKLDSKIWTWVFATEKRTAKVALSMLATMLVLMTGIAAYFAVVTDQQNKVLANTAVQAVVQNQTVINEVRDDITKHAQASASRACATAKELVYLATHPAKVNGKEVLVYRTPHQLDVIRKFQNEACAYVVPTR